MTKTIRAIAVLLCLSLMFGGLPTVRARDGERTITISTAEEFLAFSENCRLDSYSQGLTVRLEKDIDLSGVEFSGIPIFCGTFLGNHHTVSGVSIAVDGSNQGFFRYLRDTAVVRNLTVAGTVAPGGSRSNVGGIVGSNSGQIISCAFSGEVSGGDRVGGIAGNNTLSGTISGCRVSGNITGDHFVGGIAGSNSGVIRDGINSAPVNTTEVQNRVDVTEITLETITGTESVAAVTDIGGIAGENRGVIRDCENRGDVGYRHMGYNVGGIAGSQSGYMTGCLNHGSVSGRKEVGGIVGQMEPTIRLTFEEDTLQILQGQMDTMGAVAGQTVSAVKSEATSIKNQVGALQDQVKDAQNALDTLVPDRDDTEIPDPDSLLAAQNVLAGSLSDMQGTLRDMATGTYGAINELNSNVTALTGQMSQISQTISSAAENLGGSVTDISDLDTEDDLSGKVSDCKNYGDVLGDRNTGGIAGSVSAENDLDPEEDLEIIGNGSMNFESELRAVLLRCENAGGVTVKKQNGGGIAGYIALGLIRDSLNTGAVSGESGENIGGIAGRSLGYIRQCGVKCTVSGAVNVGGIAGSGVTVSQCRAMVRLDTADEKQGAILGTRGDEGEVAENYYLPVGADPGGIDAISYDGVAQSLSEEEFFALEELHGAFRYQRIYAVYEDGTRKTITLPHGSEVSLADILPDLPEKAGYAATWQSDDGNMTEIIFDTVFRATYTPLETVIASEVTGEKDLPVLLAQGTFDSGATVTVEELTDTPETEKGERILSAWQFAVPDSAGDITLRALKPEDADEDRVRVMVRDDKGIWRETPSYVNGSYLVFDAQAGDAGFCLIALAPNYGLLMGLCGGALLLILLTVILVCRKRRKKSARAPKDSDPKPEDGQ